MVKPKIEPHPGVANWNRRE